MENRSNRQSAQQHQQDPTATSEEIDQALKGTFPASDPPASHLPDVPPANADAKWRAAEAHAKQTTPDPPARAAPEKKAG